MPNEKRKKLYDGLVEDGLYTKSYEEFEQKYSDPTNRQKLYQGLTSDGLYTKSQDDFNMQYFDDVVKKKEQPVLSTGSPVGGSVPPSTGLEPTPENGLPVGVYDIGSKSMVDFSAEDAVAEEKKYNDYLTKISNSGVDPSRLIFDPKELYAKGIDIVPPVQDKTVTVSKNKTTGGETVTPKSTPSISVIKPSGELMITPDMKGYKEYSQILAKNGYSISNVNGRDFVTSKNPGDWNYKPPKKEITEEQRKQMVLTVDPSKLNADGFKELASDKTNVLYWDSNPKSFRPIVMKQPKNMWEMLDFMSLQINGKLYDELGKDDPMSDPNKLTEVFSRRFIANSDIEKYLDENGLSFSIDNIRNARNSFEKGVWGVTSSTLKGAGVLGSYLTQGLFKLAIPDVIQSEVLGVPDNLKDPVGNFASKMAGENTVAADLAGKYYRNEINAQEYVNGITNAGLQLGPKVNTPEEIDNFKKQYTDNFLSNQAVKIDKWAKNKFKINPYLQDDFLRTVLPSGAGSALVFVGAGLASGGSTTGATVTASTVGALSNAGSVYDDAIANGATPDRAFNSFVMGLGAGALEGAPVGVLFSKLSKIAPGAVKNTLLRMGGAALAEGTTEGIQEFTTSVLNNMNAAAFYDASRDIITEETWKEAGAGVILGFLMGGVGGALKIAVGEDRQKLAEAQQNLIEAIRQYEELQGTNKNVIDVNGNPILQNAPMEVVPDYVIDNLGKIQDPTIQDVLELSEKFAMSESQTNQLMETAGFGLSEVQSDAVNTQSNEATPIKEVNAVPSEYADLEDFSNKNEYYRVVVGDGAFADIVESGLVRSVGSPYLPNVERTRENLLGRRPTSFPSFSKGKASISYAQANPNNYIIVTSDPSIKPSTSGIHGKGTTMFPTDANGNALKTLDATKVKVYKHIGDNKYQLVYENGNVIKEQNTPTPTEEIQSRVAVITTQEDAKKLAEDVMFSDLPKEEKQALLNEILTKQEEILQSQPVAEEGPVDIPAPIVEEVAPVEVTPTVEETVVETPITETDVAETAPVVEPTPTKEPIKIGQKLEYRDTENGPRLMNTETGKPADLGSIRTYQDDITEAKKEDWVNEGVTVEEDQNRAAYFNDVENNSTNPFQIAEAFVESEAFPFEERGGYKNDVIADELNGSVVDKQSFIDFGDEAWVNELTKPSAKSKKPGFLFGEKGDQIDMIAEAASSISGMEVTPQDIVDFMTTYGSVDAYFAQKKNPNAKGLQQKFKDLTGIPLNAKLAEKLAAQNLENKGLALAKQEQLFLESEATSYEDVKRQFEEYLNNNPTEAERFYAGEPITGETIEGEVSNVSKPSDEGAKGEGAEEVSIAEQTKALADNIRRLRVDTKGTAGINIAPAVWNTAVDIVADIVENGGKIADAVSKGVKYIKETEAYKKATVADKKILEAQFKEAFGMFEDVKIPKNTKKTIEASTGVTKERTKVVVDEMTELKRQIRAEARAAAQGFRQGVSDTKKAGREFAAKIAEAIKPLGSKLNPSQIKALVGRAAKVSTERQLEKFQEYAEKVIIDANYADNLAAVAKAIKQLKRNVKDRNSIKIKEIGRLDLSQLTPQQISELNDVLAAANQRVPDTSLLEAYDVPVAQKIPRQAKSMDDYLDYKNALLAEKINDLDDVRRVARKFNTARRMLDAMLAQGIITDAEHEVQMMVLDSLQDLEDSKFGDEVNEAKRQAVDNIQTNLRENWDKENFTAEENDFISKLKSLTGDEMFDLNIGDLDALSDVSDRIANGTIPLNIATSIYGRAIGKARGAKVAEQVNEAAKKGIIPSDGQISETGGTAKELARAEAQSVEDVLNLGRGRAVYSYLYNIFSRAATAIMRSNDALFKKYKDVAGEEGMLSSAILKVGSWVGAGTRVPKFVKKRILQKSKVMMARYASMVRNTKGSVYGFEISSIDYFGLLLGNEATYDALVPTDGNNDVEAAKQQIRDRIEEQVGAYKTKRDGKIDGISQLDIMREIYETFPKKSDGSVDWDAITLTPQEQKIANVVDEILEELRNKQRFANEAKGLPFEEQFDYIKTDWLKRDSDFSSAENLGKEGTRAGSSYVRNDFRPGALNINLDQLMANSIDETNKDYYFTNADMEIKPTLAYAGESIISKKAKDVVKVTLKQDLSARKDFFNSKFSVHPYIRRLMNAGYIGALVNAPTRIIDTLVSTSKIPLLLGSPKPFKAIFSPLQRKAFAKLIEMTDSSLGTKLSKWKDPSFQGKRSDPNLFERVTDRIISVDETINLVGAWMPNFTMEFASLSGEQFDLNKFVSDPDYAEEFRREIEDAASYADREAKKIYGGGSKFEQRRAVQIFPVFRGLDADSYPGVFAAYLGSFGYRERTLLWQAMSDMVLARNQDRPIAALRAFGVMKATIAYGMLASAAYAGRMMLMGDDEEKKKGEQMLKDLSSPEGIMKEAGASLGLLGLSKYGQAGRYLSTLSLSVMYANTKDKGTQELIKTFMKENLYSRPIIMSKDGIVISASELIPPLTASLSSVFKIVNGGYGYGKNNPDAITAIYDKYEKGGINALTKTERDKWALITLTYNMMTLVGSQFGYAPPFKADLERVMKTQLKEADKNR